MKESDAKEMMCPVLSGIVMTQTEELTGKSVFHTYTFNEEKCKGKGCAMWEDWEYSAESRFVEGKQSVGYCLSATPDYSTKFSRDISGIKPIGERTCIYVMTRNEGEGECGYKSKGCGG